MLIAASERSLIGHNPRMGTTDKASLPLPTGQQLLTLEAQVRQPGTILTSGDLLGSWQLQQVWPKGSSSVNALSSALLRSLGARLLIGNAEPGCAESGSPAFTIGNSVRFGALELRFEGCGNLIGKRPLLQFSFSRLKLCLGPAVLLERRLPAMPTTRLPFFALIARDPSGWLAARGRGGGLALWRPI